MHISVRWEGNELRIVSGIPSGYNGEGPRGVLLILRDAGFEVE